MDTVTAIQRKRIKLAVGVSSGTSADGIDTVLVELSENGTRTRIKVLDFATYKIKEELKKTILKNSNDKTAELYEICLLNVLLGRVFAESVLRICRKNGLQDGKKLKLDFIGSHGQTIHHIPYAPPFLGRNLRSTMQIGDPSVIAALTGVTTIGDFRIADCAVGGHGAPLVPFLDYILFRSNTSNRGLLNLGGISNITVIPRQSRLDDIRAFDTGPGNMVIDGLMKRLYKRNYDHNGSVARRGVLNKKLFEFLQREEYYQKSPPKSTGREVYGTRFQDEIMGRAKKTLPGDIIRTVTEFTAYTISYNYNKFIKKYCSLDELIVSGGGVWNSFLMTCIKENFDGVRVKPIKHEEITADSKEAVLFAILANECLAGNSANIRSVTGGRSGVILGKVCPGNSKINI